MSVSGLCEVCESRPVTDGCERCGQVVCEQHHDEETGLCTACYVEVHGSRPLGDGGGTRGRERDYPDGVDEYRF
jgi:hypothetical protein